MNERVVTDGRGLPWRAVCKIADDALGAALLHAARLAGIAHERRHLVPAAHQRLENRAADVAGRARQKNPHRFNDRVADEGCAIVAERCRDPTS